MARFAKIDSNRDITFLSSYEDYPMVAEVYKTKSEYDIRLRELSTLGRTIFKKCENGYVIIHISSNVGLFAGLVKGDKELIQRTRNFLWKKMRNVSNQVLKIFSGDKSDIEKMREARSLRPPKRPQIEQAKGRRDSRVNDILSIVPQETIIQDYLDVGCSEGQITSAMTIELGLDKSHSFACDAIDQPESREFTFSKSTQETLPYPDAKFDLITLFMSIHHFLKPDKMMSEIRRVLKDTGIVVIREHDAKTDTQKAFYDIVHAVYACILGDEMSPEEFLSLISKKEYSFYRSEDELREMFGQYGFKYITSFQTGDMFDAFYSSFSK